MIGLCARHILSVYGAVQKISRPARRKAQKSPCAGLRGVACGARLCYHGYIASHKNALSRPGQGGTGPRAGLRRAEMRNGGKDKSEAGAQSAAAPRKKRVFSGIQPTGVFTLGNYVGAVRNWPKLQDEYECIYSVVDEHAITVRQDPAALRRQTRETAALLLASGISPEKSVVFVQSHVPAHAQLSWVLSCFCPFGDLTRMHQFKEKSAKHPEDINGGLLTYPILMAADILLYQTDLVPIGIDQKQHLELARNIAQRFNGVYSPTFTMPDGYIPQVGAKVMSLQEPEKKMSKSDANENAVVRMLDTPDAILRKFKRAVTDSDGCVRAGADKPGVTNLMSIYGVLTGKSFADIEREFDGRGYGEFKQAVAQTVVDALRPIQQEYARLLADRGYLDGVLAEGAVRAGAIARRTLAKVYKKIGFLQL